MIRNLRAIPLLIALSPILLAQEPVTIHVDAGQTTSRFRPVWNYFGYDEPNYTYAENGRKLLKELADLSKEPVQVRTHNLLTTGDAVAALKWGSTNAYTEDASGKPVYNWTIVDRILSTYLSLGIKPFVEIGFMPKALSTHPDPYQHNFPQGDVFTGWSYPPTSYEKWSELVYQWVKHCTAKYGVAEAQSWAWEVWNEPDIGYWHGTPEEYDKLYDYTVAAVRKALPGAHVGGPASTGPSGKKAAAFLRQFLEHCSSHDTPLDFITFHAKGHPEFVEGHVVMGITHELQDAVEGFRIVHSFDKFKNLPIILSEADPEGCAACSARTNPANAYRNGDLYPVYTAVAMKALLQLAEREQVNLQGILTWAFEFEGQPYFEGFRTLATNGIDKPILNFFRMAGLMTGSIIPVTSISDVPLDTLMSAGARQHPDVDAMAVRNEHRVAALVWNYRDEDVLGASANVKLQITGLPATAQQVLINHYRIDRSHSNAYTIWKLLGSPQEPTSQQRDALEQASQLQTLDSPHWVAAKAGAIDLDFSLPLHGLSLVEAFW
ncbi:MAG TPA: beta-xylosidase [Bryobacteraceae bacterium]|nr:beta-xylosidase [Bryobacteraceae bacterium]